MSGKRRGVLLRGMLAALFIASGLVHLVSPQVYLPMMPPYLPYPSELILVSGVAALVELGFSFHQRGVSPTIA